MVALVKEPLLFFKRYNLYDVMTIPRNNQIDIHYHSLKVKMSEAHKIKAKIVIVIGQKVI